MTYTIYLHSHPTTLTTAVGPRIDPVPGCALPDDRHGVTQEPPGHHHRGHDQAQQAHDMRYVQSSIVILYSMCI